MTLLSEENKYYKYYVGFLCFNLKSFVMRHYLYNRIEHMLEGIRRLIIQKIAYFSLLKYVKIMLRYTLNF